MAHFLRDQNISNLTVDEDAIKQISSLFLNQLNLMNSAMPRDENTGMIQDDGTGKIAFLTYIIRCDGKGCRVFSIEDLLQYFHQAKNIERIIFTLETGESIRSIRKTGACMELVLDQANPNGCFLMATSDDRNWVDASYAAVKEILDKCKNWNGWARTAWTRLLIQVVGMMAGFVLSFWIAANVSSRFIIANSFVICFLFVLLIFSNTWSFLSEIIIGFVNHKFPSIKIYRPDKDRMHWVMQAIIGGMAFAVTWWMLSEALRYIGSILSGFVR